MVVDASNASDVEIELLPMYRAAADGALQRCVMWNTAASAAAAVYPDDCAVSDAQIRRRVPRDALSPLAAMVWSPAQKRRSDVLISAPGVWGAEYAFTWNQSSYRSATPTYTEWIEIAISQPVNLVSLEVGSPRGMGAITRMYARAVGGAWLLVYEAESLKGLSNAQKLQYHRWLPNVCRPHVVVSEFRLELDTSLETVRDSVPPNPSSRRVWHAACHMLRPITVPPPRQPFNRRPHTSPSTTAPAPALPPPPHPACLRASATGTT